MIYLGKKKPGSTIYIPFNTFSSDDPTASMTITGLATTDIEIYKDGGTTQRASDAGYTLLDTDGIDFDGITGIHGFSIDLADNTTAGFYEAGSQYWVVISSITLDAATINFVPVYFEIGYEGALLDTTIATLSSQTSFTLEEGPAEDNALNNCPVIVHDVASAVQVAMGYVSDYTGATKTVTLASDPGIFTMAAGDNISFFMSSNVAAVSGIAQTANDNGADINSILATVNHASYGNAQLVRSTTPANTLDVSATGEAGLDFDNIKDATGAHTLTNITVPTVTTNSDMRGTDSAALASVCTETRLAELDAANLPTDVAACATAAKLTKYVQLLARSDAAIETDNATELTEINADGGSGAGNFSAQTDSGEAIRDHVGDGTNLTEAGGTGDQLTAITTAIADVPTVAEFEARTLVAADYVVVGDTIAGVTTVTNLTNAPTSGDLTATMKASINAECDTALSDIHLDHLLAADYDPAAKPGVATALLNELVENDGGVSRFTENALEQAPSGTGASAASIADAVWDEAIADHVAAGSFGTKNQKGVPSETINDYKATGFSTHSAADVVNEWETQSQADPTGFHVNVKEIGDAAAAATKLALSAGTIVAGTVSHDNTVATTTVFYSDDITEATSEHYNGRIVIFTSGDLQNQATDITDYELVTGEGKFTVTALTEAPADNVTFVIV
jgi:hypothetical protein